MAGAQKKKFLAWILVIMASAGCTGGPKQKHLQLTPEAKSSSSKTDFS